jgi:hypothetical protein
LALFSLAFVYAQEFETPLYQNWQLKQYDNGLKLNPDLANATKNSLNKIYSNTRFPLIDNFDTSNSIFWYENSSLFQILNRAIQFLSVLLSLLFNLSLLI